MESFFCVILIKASQDQYGEGWDDEPLFLGDTVPGDLIAVRYLFILF
jgi:hypothetical protein